jgi:hypothetical protein
VVIDILINAAIGAAFSGIWYGFSSWTKNHNFRAGMLILVIENLRRNLYKGGIAEETLNVSLWSYVPTQVVFQHSQSDYHSPADLDQG